MMGIAADLTVLAAGTATTPDPLAEVKSWVEIIGNVITPLAVIVGATWAYFKFYKERTYRPHIEVSIDDEWVPEAGVSIAVTLKNIGKARFDLVEEGTGLQVSLPAPEQPSPVREFAWVPEAAFAIFEKHAWIEPGESLTDQLLVRLDDTDSLIEATTRLVFRSYRKPVFKDRAENIEVQARRVLHRPEPPGEEPVKGTSDECVADAGGQGHHRLMGGPQEADGGVAAGPAVRGS